MECNSKFGKKWHNARYFPLGQIISKNHLSYPKGRGAIVELKQNQELLVRFGYNLGQLFRDSPWSYNPLYTQIGLVNKSTHRVNMDAMPETSSAKQREGLARFGCNLSQMFRDTSWFLNLWPSLHPEQASQQSTLEVNTTNVMPKTKSAK